MDSPLASSRLTTITFLHVNRQLQLTDVVGVETESVWNISVIGTKGKVQLAGCEVHWALTWVCVGTVPGQLEIYSCWTRPCMKDTSKEHEVKCVVNSFLEQLTSNWGVELRKGVKSEITISDTPDAENCTAMENWQPTYRFMWVPFAQSWSWAKSLKFPGRNASCLFKLKMMLSPRTIRFPTWLSELS